MFKHVLRHVACSAYSAYIVRGDIWDATVVAVQQGSEGPWLTIPFGQHPVERLLGVDDRYLVAFGRLGMNEGYCMAVLDTVEQRRVSPVVSDREIILSSQLVVSQKKDRLWLANGIKSRSWSLPQLTEFEPLKTPFLHAQEACLRDDGAIVVKGYDKNTKYSDERPAPALLFVISPDGVSAEPHGVSRHEPWKQYPATYHSPYALSATGRYLLRAHDGAILLSDADGQPLVDLPAVEAVKDADVIPLLQRIHISGVQDIWSAAPFAFERRIIVMRAPLFDCLTAKPSAEGIDADARRKVETDRWLKLRDGGGDPAASSAAAAEAKRLGDEHHHFVMSRWLLRRALRFAELAPFHAWSPGDPEFFEKGTESDRGNLHQNLLTPLNAVRGALSHWEDSDAGFVLHFPNGRQRRVGVDGSLGPIEPVRRQERTDFAPPELEKAARKFIEQASVAVFKLESLDDRSCIKAIDDLTDRLRKDRKGVIWGREMKLRFVQPAGVLSEEQFFEHVAAKCPNAAASLRALMASFDELDLKDEVWSTELVSASGFPALALARLDPDAYRLLGGYFERRDPGHEPFGLEAVFPALAPFRTADGLRFALERLRDEEMYGHGDHGRIARRLIHDAQAFCSPPDAVDAVRAFLDQQVGDDAADVRRKVTKAILHASDRANDWEAQFVKLAQKQLAPT